MRDDDQTPTSPRIAVDLKDHLAELQAERALASLEGLGANTAYVSHLDRELVATHQAYVMAAVTEIAALLADLSGAQVG